MVSTVDAVHLTCWYKLIIAFVCVDEIEVWSDLEDDDSGKETPSEEPPILQENHESNTSSSVLVRWLLTFFLRLQSQFYLADRVLGIIFAFLKAYFLVLGRLYAPCATIGQQLPLTVYMARKVCHRASFHILPVCKRCGTVWTYQDCIEEHGRNRRAKVCSHIDPLGRRKNECSGVLLKTVELASGKKVFYPLMTYCYIDLKTSLQHLLLDPNFTSQCNHWKLLSSSGNELRDVYDGRVWNSFRKFNGSPFLDDDNVYAFMINMDWFQPYKHLTYSVGAIYLSIFNLPRSMRYQLQNICLVGIIPGPSEPELTVNQYIKPLVNDLLILWDSMELEVNLESGIQRKLVRGAIICCSCDLPAGRKLCGFLGHSAHLGCSKCKKYFLSTENGLDYSGFMRQSWVPRSNSSHREDVSKLDQCKSKTARQRMEKALGCRYSSLLDLPYFDPPTMLVIDPMHCLFLGLAKHFLKKALLGRGILSEKDLSIIQSRIDAMRVPSDIGRIPHKIQQAFYSFTADQYKNWVLHYSIISLHGMLSSEILECWRHFVLACRYLCQPILTQNDVKIGDALLLKFCSRTEALFGKDIITPNMHMSCHLRECILDYGPLNHFWLFAFERFNGILGKLPNNNRSIETQMMKRFINDTAVLRTPCPEEFKDDFLQFIPFHQLPAPGGTSEASTTPGGLNSIELPHNSVRSSFNATEMEAINSLISTLYPEHSYQIASTFLKYQTLKLKGKVHGSYRSRSKNSSTVLADLHGETRPARINFFACVSVSSRVSEIHSKVILVSLNWFKSHPQRNVCGKPVTIWECDLFDDCNFLPADKILCRTVTLVDKLNDTVGNVLFVSPYT